MIDYTGRISNSSMDGSRKEYPTMPPPSSPTTTARKTADTRQQEQRSPPPIAKTSAGNKNKKIEKMLGRLLPKRLIPSRCFCFGGGGGEEKEEEGGWWFTESTLDPGDTEGEIESLARKTETLMLMCGLAHEHHWRRAIAWDLLVLSLGVAISILGLLTGHRLDRGIVSATVRDDDGGVSLVLDPRALTLGLMGIALTIAEAIETRLRHSSNSDVQRLAADALHLVASRLRRRRDDDSSSSSSPKPPGSDGAEDAREEREKGRDPFALFTLAPVPIPPPPERGLPLQSSSTVFVGDVLEEEAGVEKEEEDDNADVEDGGDEKEKGVVVVDDDDEVDERLALARAGLEALERQTASVPPHIKKAFLEYRDRTKGVPEDVRSIVDRRYTFRLARLYRRPVPAWWIERHGAKRLYEDLEDDCHRLGEILMSGGNNDARPRRKKKEAADAAAAARPTEADDESDANAA